MAKRDIKNSDSSEGVVAVENNEAPVAFPVSEEPKEVVEETTPAELTAIEQLIEDKKAELAEIEQLIEDKKAELAEIEQLIEDKKAELEITSNGEINGTEEQVDIEFNYPTIRHNGVQYQTKELEKQLGEGNAEAFKILKELIDLKSGAITVKKKGE